MKFEYAGIFMPKMKGAELMKKRIICTGLATTMLLTTTASATAKPWWLSRYRVTFDNELGIVGNVTLQFASDGVALSGQ